MATGKFHHLNGGKRLQAAYHHSPALNPSTSASPLGRAMPVAINAGGLRVELFSTGAGAGHQLAIG